MRSQAHKEAQKSTRKSTANPETTVFGTEELPRKSNIKTESGYGSGYKSQYNKGNNQYYGNKPLYQGHKQPGANQTPDHQLRI